MTRIYPEINHTITSAVDLIKKSHRTVALTGAGVSTPSGIPDFRTPGVGLWTRFQPMDVASLTVFRHNPEQFYQWLHPLAKLMYTAQPNPAHFAIANLEKAGYISTIITQNIDGLHTRAGAKNVLEVHGSLDTLTCTNCYRQYTSATMIGEYIDHCTLPHCQVCGSILKPDIILYEEQLPVKIWLKAEETCKDCDLMMVVGTSLEVMPSAKLPIQALDHGARLIVINKAQTYLDVRADVVIKADVAEILPRITNELLNV